VVEEDEEGGGGVTAIMLFLEIRSQQSEFLPDNTTQEGPPLILPVIIGVKG